MSMACFGHLSDLSGERRDLAAEPAEVCMEFNLPFSLPAALVKDQGSLMVNRFGPAGSMG